MGAHCGIPELLRRIWLFSANKIKSSETISKQPTQLIFEPNSSLQHIIVTMASFGKVFRCFSRSGEKFTSEEELT